jgi:hypothetical protein
MQVRRQEQGDAERFRGFLEAMSSISLGGDRIE